MTQSKYDSYGSTGGSSSGSQSENVELLYTPEASFEGTLSRVFGTSSQYGQSLGVVWEDVEITDGCLYYDVEKDKYKLFSWKKAAGMSPGDAIERGTTLTTDDADDTMTKTYAGNDKTYDLIAAVVEEVEDDGEVLIEADSKSREVLTPGEYDFSEWTDHGGDPVPFEDDMLSWYDGSEEYGPGTAAKGVAETLSEYGEDMVVDEDDIHGWLADDSGNNIVRDDLEGMRMEHFLTVATSESGFNYHVPHFIDVENGIEVVPDNRDDGGSEADDTEARASGGGSGNSDSGSALVQAADNTYPEPVADFIQSAQSLELDPDRASDLLDDMIGDGDTALTSEMVDEAGGRGVVIEEVV